MRSLTTISRFFCVCCIMGFLAMGCTEEQETREIEFSLSRYSVAFDVGGGITSLTVGTSDSWTASADAAWLSLGQDGSTLYITAEANNETTDIREAEVTVATSSYGSATIQVRQAPAETPEVSLSYGSSDCTIDSEGGTFTVVVKSNYDWTASLDEDIEGWNLTCNTAAGTATVTAGANYGATLTGKIVVVAGTGALTTTQEVEVIQTSHYDNQYYQFIGHWLVSAADCYVGGAWAGQEGIYTSCNVIDYDYSLGKLGLADYDVEGLEIDRIEYYPEEGYFLLPLGFLGGIVYGGSYGTSYYTYLVAFNEEISSFSTSYSLVFELNGDGTVASVSGLDDEHPILGWVGYNSYYGYITFSNIHYCKAPLSLTKSEETETSCIIPTNFTAIPVGELPDDVPARLPKGFVGQVSAMKML